MRVLVVTAMVAALAACAETNALNDQRAPLRVSGVPFHSQEGFRCGPAAMAMMLGWTGSDVRPAALESLFPTAAANPRPVLAEAARRHGRLAYPVAGMEALRQELAAGHPVLVLQNLGVPGQPIWNCGVAVGYDREQRQFLLNSGNQAAKRVSESLFERLWSDAEQWGLVVLKPGDLPATAKPGPYLEAARALERGGRHWEAVLAYDGALSLWPNQADALMGLGSSLYLLGDGRGAADAYRAAAAISANPGPALAALAQVLKETGRRDEARAVAEKAANPGLAQPARFKESN